MHSIQKPKVLLYAMYMYTHIFYRYKTKNMSRFGAFITKVENMNLVTSLN